MKMTDEKAFAELQKPHYEKIFGKHEISDKMIDNLKEIAYKQDDFGVEKYKKPLTANLNYDWLQMAMEELVDLGKYLECETERKEVVKVLLNHAVKTENWDLVKLAYNELSKTGTGK